MYGLRRPEWCQSTMPIQHPRENGRATEKIVQPLSYTITECVCWKIGRKIDSDEAHSAVHFLAFRIIESFAGLRHALSAWCRDE